MNYLYKQREANLKITQYLDSVLESLEHIDYYIDTVFNRADLSEILDEDLPDSERRENKIFFIEDIVDICCDFLKQCNSQQLRLQLEVVRTDKCLLFHADNIRQRLLCTYYGPGSEWSDDFNVNRECLGKGCNQKIIKDTKQIRRANEFDILVLKGDLFQEKMNGVVHRSPPIEKTQETRVLLKIDEL